MGFGRVAVAAGGVLAIPASEMAAVSVAFCAMSATCEPAPDWTDFSVFALVSFLPLLSAVVCIVTAIVGGRRGAWLAAPVAVVYALLAAMAVIPALVGYIACAVVAVLVGAGAVAMYRAAPRALARGREAPPGAS